MIGRSCGIDFGTSNSTVGIRTKKQYQLVPLEQSSTNIPSALFFDLDRNSIKFGRNAIAQYALGHRGRFMRALKSILGSSLLREKTRIGTRTLPFNEIIGMFVGHLKHTAEQYVHGTIDFVVMGRPVFFVDGDEVADRSAQSALEAIARGQNFKEVQFQYEPVAAALEYERTCSKEEIALVIDIGGGTADFSVVRVSPERHSSSSRKDDVLSSFGIHIGGTDFDRELSLRSVMPSLGYGSTMSGLFDRSVSTTVPSHIFVDLATWHMINFLYSRKNISEVRSLLRVAHEPKRFLKLIDVLENQRGHEIAHSVEAAKIELSELPAAQLELPIGDKGEPIHIGQKILNDSIGEMVAKLKSSLLQTLRLAQVEAQKIETAFLTGGSTSLTFVRESLLELVPNAKIVTGDKFGSVGIGLAIDAYNKFGR